MVLAQTLGVLRTSLGNLRRGGFETVYRKRAWCRVLA